MKYLSCLLILTLFFSCVENTVTLKAKLSPDPEINFIVEEFQSVIDSAKVEGSILIFDQKENKYYSNNFEKAKESHLPASTFKIMNSIVALESGILENDSEIIKWDGESRRLKAWEQDLSFRNAFHNSCVPCYQEIARNVGAKSMNEYLDKLDYGNMIVDSSNIDLFWLEGESRISPYEQVDFLKRFFNSELPISEKTETIMKRMMVIEDNKDYKLSGKTGWSIRNGNNNGWFVGYIESNNKTYFFATNVVPQRDFNMTMFPMIRKKVTYKALEQIGIKK